MFTNLEGALDLLDVYAGQKEKEYSIRYIHDHVLRSIVSNSKGDPKKWIVSPTRLVRTHISQVAGAPGIMNALGFVQIDENKDLQRKHSKWQFRKPQVWGDGDPFDVLDAAAKALKEKIEFIVVTRQQQKSNLERSRSLRHGIREKSPEAKRKSPISTTDTKTKSLGKLMLELNGTKTSLNVSQSTTVAQVRKVLYLSLSLSLDVGARSARISLSFFFFLVHTSNTNTQYQHHQHTGTKTCD